MLCEICRRDPQFLMLLPLPQSDGNLCTFACEACAQKSSAYCTLHQTIHQGFIDETTACLICIQQEVSDQSLRSEAVCKKLQLLLSPEWWEVLVEAADLSAEITGTDRGICIIRFIATKAMRVHEVFDATYERILKAKSPASILY